MNEIEWQISNATLVQGDNIRKTSGFLIQNGTIKEIDNASQTSQEIVGINLHGLFVFPGLINAHDNLLAAYYRFQGVNHPYRNWLAWDNELKSSSLFRQRMLLDTADLYQLGSYRNILSGVTTVVDHIPHTVREPYHNGNLVLPRLLSNFGISHSVCSYSLGWGKGIRQEYEYATENNLPYIIHIAEGFDRESLDSLSQLKKLGALGPHTVLVHGLFLQPNDIEEIAKAKAHLVWCPQSSEYIYQTTPPIREALQSGINVCLGSDAAMYGSNHLLEDIRFAKECYQKKYDEELDSSLLLKMATLHSVKAFHLSNTEGTLNVGAKADFFVLQGKYSNDPIASLIQAELDEVYLVVRDGELLYGDEALKPIFISQGTLFERFVLGKKNKIIKKHGLRDLKSLLEKSATQNQFPFLPIKVQ